MDEQEDILLQELYFVISYPELVQTIDWDDSYNKTLENLLQKGWVVQLQYNKDYSDFVKLEEPDVMSLSEYSYLATKKGLLEHSGL